MKWIVFLPCILLLFPSLAVSQILLNEVYYDHPGSDTGHEFIELMNVSMVPVLLTGYEIEFHDGASGTWKRIWSAMTSVLQRSLPSRSWYFDVRILPSM